QVSFQLPVKCQCRGPARPLRRDGRGPQAPLVCDLGSIRKSEGAGLTTATENHTEHTIDVAGLTLRYLRGGAGTTVVVLHRSRGNPGWIPFYERLAERASVYVPDMPGYGQSARPDWAREPRDLAILLLQVLTRLELPRVALVGLGLGGFIAAEMATM